MRNQNIIIICSYNIDLTRNAGKCLFKMLENKSSIFLYSVIYFVSYESEICFELWIIPKNGEVGLVSKTQQYLKFRICSKMENLILS